MTAHNSSAVVLHWRIFFGFSGCVFHSTGFHIHDHEPDIHRARLDERRKAKSRRPLKCTPPSPSATAAHCGAPPQVLWMGSKIQPTAGRLGALVGLFLFILRTICSSRVMRGAQVCPVTHPGWYIPPGSITGGVPLFYMMSWRTCWPWKPLNHYKLFA